MKILITGNMGYVGPLVLRRLRESHPRRRTHRIRHGLLCSLPNGSQRGFRKVELIFSTSGISKGILMRSCGESMPLFTSVRFPTIRWVLSMKM